MWTNTIVLNSAEHAHLTLAPTTDWRFSSEQMVIPIEYSELANAAREYALIFLTDRPGVYALLGIEKNVNAYVDGEGRWLATYIPARLRAYPFTLATVAKHAEKLVLAADADAPQLKSGSDKLFDNKQLGAEAQRRLKILESLQKAVPATTKAVAALRNAGLLVDRALQIRKAGSEDEDLRGFQVVDEAKLNALDDSAFNQLRREGALPLLYAHLLSLSNLRSGVIAGRKQKAL